MPKSHETLPTRDRILAAATEVFTRQGYAGTTTRDIAAAARVNIATLHYHHRSKEALFGVVAARAMERFNAVFDEVMAASTGTREFIRRFVSAHIELLLEFPYLVGFIQHESEASPEKFREHVDFARWSEEMEALMRRDPDIDTARPNFAGHLIANMVGALIYPFLFRTTTMHEFGMTQAAWEDFVREREGVVVGMIEGWLYGGAQPS